MVIYEHSSNGINILFAIIMILIAFLCVVGICRFSPLIKQSVELLSCIVNHEENEGFTMREHLAQFLVVLLVTIILYGVLVLGVVFGIQEATTSIQSCSNTSNVYVISGEINTLHSDAIEYRGNTLGHSLCLSLDGKEYVIKDPPGVCTESLKLLETGTKVRLRYQVKDNLNIIVKIETFT